MHTDFKIDNSQVRELLETIVPDIVDLINPLKIILFGSAARNDGGTFNDIDILIVVNEGVHRRQTAQLLYQRIRTGLIPVDFVVATQTDLDLYRSVKGYVYFKALREGVILYETQAQG